MLTLVPACVLAEGFSFGDDLVDAADRGDLMQVVRFLEQGRSVDSRGDFGVTPLMRAAFRGHLEVAAVLINAGANVDAADIGGATSLHLAARKGNTAIINMLVDRHAEIDLPDKEGWTPLMRAVVAKQKQSTKLLVAAGADVSLLNSKGDSILLMATLSNVPEIVTSILGAESYGEVPEWRGEESITVADKKDYDTVKNILMATLGKKKEEESEEQPAQAGIPQDESEDIPSLARMFKEGAGSAQTATADAEVASATDPADSLFAPTPSFKADALKEMAAAPERQEEMQQRFSQPFSGAPSYPAQQQAMVPAPSYYPQGGYYVPPPVYYYPAPVMPYPQAQAVPPPPQAQVPQTVHTPPSVAAYAAPVSPQPAPQFKPQVAVVEPSIQPELKPTAQQGVRYPPLIAPEPTMRPSSVQQSYVPPQMAEMKPVEGLPWLQGKQAASVQEEGIHFQPVAPSAPVEASAAPTYTPVASYVPPAPPEAKAYQPEVQPEPVMASATGEEAANSHYLLHLGAFASEDQALYIWSNLKHANPDVLSELKPDILKAFLASEGGTVQRLRAGYYNRKQDATNACNMLRKRNVDCFIVESSSGITQEALVREAPGAPVPPGTMITAQAQPQPVPVAIPSPVMRAPEPQIAAVPQPVPVAAPQSENSMIAYNDAPQSILQPSPALPVYDIPKTENVTPEISQEVINSEREAFFKEYGLNAPPVTPDPYDEFYREVQKTGGKMGVSPVSEAVPVAEGDFAGIAQPFSATANGPIVYISEFYSPQESQDFYERMFRYDTQFSYLAMNVAPLGGAQQASALPGHPLLTMLQLGPTKTDFDAQEICRIAYSSGKKCTIPGSGKPSAETASFSSQPAAQFWVNLGAFNNDSEAEYYWMFLMEEQQDVLSSLKYDLSSYVDNKGQESKAVTLRVGPFPVSERAEKLCNILRMRNIGCIISQ